MIGEITKITRYQTADGKEHTTIEMAKYHLLNEELVKILDGPSCPLDGQDVLNTLSNHRKLLRDWIDSIDEMEKAALR